ncbi:MAG: NADH-ubiquinone oxidoreductase-F iron-sulfur binding region domain-containing protein [Phycisphaerae bacterium]
MLKNETNVSEAGTVRCWQGAGSVAPELLESLKVGPWASVKGDKAALESLLTRLRRQSVDKPVIFLGTGTCGLGAGAGKTLEAIRAFLKREKVDAEVVEVGCIGLCSEEPLLDVQLPGRTRLCFSTVMAKDVAGILTAVLGGSLPLRKAPLAQFRGSEGVQQEAWKDVPWLDEHPFLAKQRRVVLATSGLLDPSKIDEYIAWGGYSAMARVLRSQTPEQVAELVELSGLRGRGGGGFPTGKKWKFAQKAAADQKYLICNADEGDPGAFMDRAVGESDPHRLIEGMVIAAYAIGATKAYIYIRAEYPLAVERLTAAIEQAKAYGLIGENIHDSGNSLEIKLKKGAGAFVCGEETALIHSIEGKRGMPRPRPPFPAVSGLFGKPTVINNVETLTNLPMIFDRGADWYAGMGTPGSKGTKVFALSGMVRRTGLVEVPMGTTLREVVYDVGGGIPNGKKCKAVQIGGPSGGCVPEAHLDIATDYEALKNFGTIMGSGGLVVVDESTCMVDFAKFFMEFIQTESCGKCIPCREGTRNMLEILKAITRPRRAEDEADALIRFQGIMRLQALGEMIKSTSLCGLGQTAPNPVLSTLKWFRDEYEAHVYERRCPAGACKDLVGTPCQNACPAGTEVWRYVAHIGRGEFEDAYKVIRQTNPFPSACARVCHHPCEQACRAGATGGESVAVRLLKRFVVDHVNPHVGTPPAQPSTADGARIAVIGAGPSGLTAAHFLSLMGHRVTVIEKEAKPGGMLESAIPAYRLPRGLVRREMDSLLNLNIEMRYNTTLGKDVTIDELLAKGYKAVYIATGAHKSKLLDLPGEDAEGIIPSMEFLKAHNLHRHEMAKGRVAVVGGGNSAMDAARVALRQQGVTRVTVLYRRTRGEMPAYPDEVEAGLVEGVELEELVAPLELHVKDGRLTGARFQRNKLGPRDATGRQKPVPIPGEEFDLEVDTLIVAISEEPESQGLEGLEKTSSGTLKTNPESFTTARAGVFAGGDVVTGPATVVGAVGAGRNAAMMIDRYVHGKAPRVLPKAVLPCVYVPPAEGVDDNELTPCRCTAPERPVAERVRSFAEVEMSISEHEAVCEARRCLRCDLDFTQPLNSRD